MTRNPFIDNLHFTRIEKDFLHVIERQMGIVADLSRADILLYAQKSASEFIVLSHAQPHSLAHVYQKARAGRPIPIRDKPEILQTLTYGKSYTDQRSVISEGAPVVRETLPVYFPPVTVPHYPLSLELDSVAQKPHVIAALIIVTNLIEHERHKFRSKVYRKELRKLQAMLISGLTVGAEDLTPFDEQDGILFVDNGGIIRYASGIAVNLYRRVGFIDTLVGRQLNELDINDEELRRDALTQKRSLQLEAEEKNRYWTRKAIPVINYTPLHFNALDRLKRMNRPRESGVLILLHDDTETRRQDEEIRIKNAMIQEVHHRVKNNLQTIAGLLRMQIRRVESEEARQVLDEALNRILSVAVIHEFLSSGGSNIINIKDVCARIVTQFQQGMLNPEKQIRLKLKGDTLFLPARQATACSLIVNELLQNSVEHGFESKQTGMIAINLEDSGDEVIITVSDNGDGVPDDFDFGQSNSLGLQIIKILAENDLKGSIALDKGIGGDGLTVKIEFPKSIFEGEEGWKEHVSL